MITSLTGVLAAKAPDGIVIDTSGGVGYAVLVPLGVYERLPSVGTRVTLHTELVVREDGWALFGFDSLNEREVFRQLLTATGFGPRLALGLLSALGPSRTVRSIRDRDLAALATVSGIGKKKAERLVLELQDRLGDVVLDSAPVPRGGAPDAVRALEQLGYPAPAAEEAVRHVLDEDATTDTAAILRRALERLAGARGGARRR